METSFDSTPLIADEASRHVRWAGHALTGVTTLFLIFDGTMKVVGHPAVAEASVRLGLPMEMNPLVGSLLFVCLATHLVRRTAVIGAVLLTGYLGGAVFAQLRIDAPLLTHTLFPVYLGAMLWAGLFLRDRRARQLIARA
ncbi:MAG: DoxX family protein [Polyangiaceae bacterium]|nr:DoxX family protein [Polyangiaceae bacterium]